MDRAHELADAVMALRGTGKLTFANRGDQSWDDDVWKALDIDGDLSSCIASLDQATPGTELIAAGMHGGMGAMQAGSAGAAVSPPSCRRSRMRLARSNS